MAGVTVTTALYGTNCNTLPLTCVDVKAKLQAICDSQSNKACKTRTIGTSEKFGQTEMGGLKAELTCSTGVKEMYNVSPGACLMACGQKSCAPN
jgi:hypothetical protein